MATQDDRRNDPTRQGLGLRMKAAREGKGLNQQEVADRLGVSNATVSAWEMGRADPGVYRLREISKLYGVAADAILWEDSLSPDAMKFAADFDALTEKQRATFRAVWVAFVKEAATDAQIEQAMPVTKTEKE
jgi:transcriptional regulator with XRE-family HTH domain